MQKKFLILTAYNISKKFLLTKNIDLFLGEWCKKYEFNEEFNNIKKIKYHWDNKNKAYKDYLYLKNLKKNLLNNLTKKLNNIHKINLSERSWNLIIGWWLYNFLTVAFDRWSMINDVNQKHPNLAIHSFKKPKDFSLETKDTKDFINRAGYDNKWNHFFYIRVCEEQKNLEIIQNQDEFSYESINYSKLKKINYFKQIGYFFIRLQNIIAKTISKKLIVFHNVVITKKNLLKLFFLLFGRIYFVINTPEIYGVSKDSTYRNWNLDSSPNDTEFERFIKIIMPELIPKSFLESFAFTLKKINSINLPNNPQEIITSNFFNNDFIKIWSAFKINKGTKLSIYSHGGGAFFRYHFPTDYELEISDTFFARGNGNSKANPKKIMDLGIIDSKYEFSKWDKNGPATIVLGVMPQYITDIRSFAISGQTTKYFEDQYLFYDNLNNFIKNKIFLRIYHKSDYGWNQKKRLRDKFPNVKLDLGNKPLYEICKSNRLIISTYNCSTYQETLAANIPTVIFYNPIYWESADWVNKDLKLLKEFGIFHDSAISASNHINKIWNNVESWWNEKELQNVRKIWCRKYASKNNHSILKLYNHLK